MERSYFDAIVDHPEHYRSSDGIEVIDVIEAFTKDLTGMDAVCTANAIKYILRWKKKGGKVDLLKAKWYIEKLVSYLTDTDEESHEECGPEEETEEDEEEATSWTCTMKPEMFETTTWTCSMECDDRPGMLVFFKKGCTDRPDEEKINDFKKFKNQ